MCYLQRNNDCKGGMMEEWHQKLHNNTSPDDVVICQVLPMEWLSFFCQGSGLAYNIFLPGINLLHQKRL